MRKVWVTDVAVATALGNDLETSWQRFVAGQTGIKPLRRFAADKYRSHHAAFLDDLRPSNGQSMIRGIIDFVLAGMGSVPKDAYLITASTKAGIDNLERFQRGIPADLDDVLPGCLTKNVARRFGLAGQGIHISAACASSAIAVGRGAALIAAGAFEAALICCFDLVTEFVLSGFSALQALSPFPCRPFDRDRAGLTLGEGAAALLLMDADSARRHKKASLGTVIGWGAANDATHVVAPAQDGCGLVRAIRQALQRAGIGEEEVAAISAHGTGTIYNDLMELTAFREVFGARKIPIYSAKGALGHSMGAAGGIELALGLKALEAQVVPPTVGCRNPEEGARDLVSSKPRDLAGDYLLTTNSGFGGINSAIVLSRDNVK
jgi:3-oxoacyl-[acyl-carrier-protein] synthase II